MDRLKNASWFERVIYLLAAISMLLLVAQVAMEFEYLPDEQPAMLSEGEAAYDGILSGDYYIYADAANIFLAKEQVYREDLLNPYYYDIYFLPFVAIFTVFGVQFGAIVWTLVQLAIHIGALYLAHRLFQQALPHYAEKFHWSFMLAVGLVATDLSANLIFGNIVVSLLLAFVLLMVGVYQRTPVWIALSILIFGITKPQLIMIPVLLLLAEELYRALTPAPKQETAPRRDLLMTVVWAVGLFIAFFVVTGALVGFDVTYMVEQQTAHLQFLTGDAESTYPFITDADEGSSNSSIRQRMILWFDSWGIDDASLLDTAVLVTKLVHLALYGAMLFFYYRHQLDRKPYMRLLVVIMGGYLIGPILFSHVVMDVVFIPVIFVAILGYGINNTIYKWIFLALLFWTPFALTEIIYHAYFPYILFLSYLALGGIAVIIRQEIREVTND